MQQRFQLSSRPTVWGHCIRRVFRVTVRRRLHAPARPKRKRKRTPKPSSPKKKKSQEKKTKDQQIVPRHVTCSTNNHTGKLITTYVAEFTRLFSVILLYNNVVITIHQSPSDHFPPLPISLLDRLALPSSPPL